MKTKFTLLFCGFALMGFAQNATTSPLIWLQPELVNPAASGLKSKFDASATAYQNFVGTYNLEWGYNASVNGKVAKLNSGFGVSYQSSNLAGQMDVSTLTHMPVFQTLRINYNYQFALKNNATLALGANYQQDIALWNKEYMIVNYPNYSDWQARQEANKINFGAVYQGEKLFLGVTFLNAITFNQGDANLDYLNRNGYSVLSSYDFAISPKWKIVPTLYYELGVRYDEGSIEFTEWRINLFMNAFYAEKLNFGFGIASMPYSAGKLLGSVGYTIAKKWQLQYVFGYAVNAYSSRNNYTYSNQIAFKYSFK